MAVHQELASGRWAELSLVEQLANIGSEVDRAIRAATGNRIERRDRAVERALELFDLTAADERWRGPPRWEVLRAREEFCRIISRLGPTPVGLARELQQILPVLRGGCQDARRARMTLAAAGL